MENPAPPRRKAGRPKGSGANRKNPKTFSGRMAEYERDLPKMTLSDRALVQAAVNMELEFDRFQKKIAEMKDGRELAKAQEAYNNSLKEYRQILVSLGIERNQRSSDIDMQSEVDKLVEESAALVEKSGRRITCIECQSDYDMGILLFHFINDVPWQFNFICPACGKPNRMSSIISLPGEVRVIEGELTS